MAADPPAPLPGPVLPAAPATMLELGAALGADIWWLEQLFAVTGGWVEGASRAAVRTHLAELSRVLGEHAQALRAHLPRPAPVDPDGWVVPPFDDAPTLVHDLRTQVGTAVPELAAVHRVLLTRLLVGWSAPLGPTGDGVRRALRAARTDLTELRDQGEALLHALMDEDPSAVERAVVAVRETEAGVAGGRMRPPTPDAPPG